MTDKYVGMWKPNKTKNRIPLMQVVSNMLLIIEIFFGVSGMLKKKKCTNYDEVNSLN